MRVLKVFLLGLIFGWFMRWIIDRIYYEDDFRKLANENEVLRERLRAREAVTSHDYASSVQRATLKSTPQPDQRPAPATTLKQSTASQIPSRKDDLKKIKGIGPVMERKLNAAGVNTFEQFSRLTTHELQNILGLSKRVVQSADNLITQAKQLAQKKSKR